MIGPVHFDILCGCYFAMLGFIWMLVDSVYHTIRPQAIPCENVPDTSTEKYDLETISIKSNPVDIEEPQAFAINLLHGVKSRLNISNEIIEKEGVIVDLDINYISKQKLISTTHNVLHEKKLAVKRPHENICDAPSNNSIYENEKLFNLIVVKKSFNKKTEINKNVFSIKEITKLITYEPASTGESPLLLKNYLMKSDEKRDTLMLPELDMEFCLESKSKRSNWFSALPSELTKYGKQLKLDDNQIVYIINHLDIEVKSQLKRKFQEMEISEYFNIKDDYSGLEIKQRTNKEPNVIITELDSNDEIETSKKHRNLRKKKNKKKHRKIKSNNQKTEASSITFSSKQCFERLAFFMSTNQRLTQSKMILEIEKEFKPLKDQISELRDSMTDFAVVNHRTNKKGVKSSKLSVKSIDKSNKPRSIFTVSSASLQKLARLADTSTNFQTNDDSEIIESEPKKLSPLAEMYIKLSRQKI